MHESPRIRRLRNDFAALERLGSESSVLRFRAEGKPAQRYVVEFRGRSLARERGKVAVRDRHEVEIKLGASYPRTMPEIRWLTPIYHPNISEIGMVCLGGYGTHWVPSLNLDELCGMLWDMARFHNYDIRSPYNREAALWVANQTSFLFPLDPRALRDLRVALGRVESQAPAPTPPSNEPEGPNRETGGAKAPSDPAPGSKAGKYADFVRKFASDLSALTPSRPDAVPRGENRDRTGTGSEVRDGIVIFDLEVDLRPESTRPHPRPDDEIVFID
jgi:ubiquitin-protein ligase